jgi:hypothetical protein
VQVDTVPTTVQGVLDRQQIEQLPLNGRNFLDLAQLQPGVQIQDGNSFDPTKNGFASIPLVAGLAGQSGLPWTESISRKPLDLDCSLGRGAIWPK